MKTILCYGDSNTWGYMPKLQSPEITANNRFPWGVRWASRLQAALGDDFRVAENGVNGRTTMFDCPMAEYRNGLKDLAVGVQSQMPVDLIIIMLGTNDLKFFFNMSAYMIAKGAQRLVEAIRGAGYGPNGRDPEILLVSPIHLHPNIAQSWLAEEFGASSVEKDAQLAAQLQAVAQSMGVHFLDAGARITADPADCIHMNAEGHALLAQMMEEKVREILGA